MKKAKKNESTESPKKFKYINLPKDRKPPYVKEDLDLQATLSLCVQELTLQQSKRDQLIAFYLTITGLVSTYIFSKDVNLLISSLIFAGIFFIGLIWTIIIIRYKVYKDVYWACSKTISSLYSNNCNEIDKPLLQHTFYSVIKKSYKGIPQDEDTHKPLLMKNIFKNITSAEYLMFLTLVLLSAAALATSVITLLIIYNVSWIYHIAVTLFIIIYIIFQTINYNKAALSIYDVAIDDLDDSFNKVFNKAWFLHFFI